MAGSRYRLALEATLDRRTVLAGLAGLGLAGLGGLGLSVLSTGPRAGAAARRVVSLSPQITETVFALGAQAALVGRSDWCLLPEAARALPGVGTALTPNLEAIVALAPSLLLAERMATAAPEALARLAPLETLPWLTVAEVVASVRRLGALLEVDAAPLAARFAALDRPPTPGPRCLVLLGVDELAKGQLWFVKRNSLHGAAIQAAGLTNAVDADVAGPPTLSVERLIALDPELIVVLSADDALDPAGEERIIAAFHTLPVLSAVRTRRIGVLHGAATLTSGPAILDLPEALASLATRLGSP